MKEQGHSKGLVKDDAPRALRVFEYNLSSYWVGHVDTTIPSDGYIVVASSLMGSRPIGGSDLESLDPRCFLIDRYPRKPLTHFFWIFESIMST